MIIRRSRATWMELAKPSTRHDDEMRLGVGPDAYTYADHGLPFDVADEVTVLSATLRCYVKGPWTAGPALTAKRITGDWSERDTWQDRPAVTGAGVTATGSALTDGSERAFDVAALYQQAADGADWYGLRIEAGGTELRHFRSPGSDFPPTLDITWTTKPDAPTGLSPSGGRSVSVAKWVVRWDPFTDPDSDAMAALQVQVDAAKNAAAPAFDSGALDATVTELDLATTAYAGLANGATTWQRARHKDVTQWSPWSDWAEVRRDNKGALNITNPAGSPSNFVTEPTPPLSAVLTGEVQTGRRVLIVDATDPTVVYHDTERVKTTATAFTPPKGVITKSGKLYRLIWRVFDSKDRVPTPGDPAYTEATRDFTFYRDATVAPVTNLSGAALSPRPWYRVTAARATAPDTFNAVVDGEVVESGLLPSDLLVSGTTYSYTFKEANPNRVHNWSLEAVVNGKTSANNPTVTGQAPLEGIWVHDRERNLEVFFSEGLASTFGLGEVGEWLDPLGSASPVRITQALQGVAAEVSEARLSDAVGRTAAQWEADLWAIRNKPARPVRLSYADQSFRAVLSNISIGPDDPDPESKLVGFTARQVF